MGGRQLSRRHDAPPHFIAVAVRKTNQRIVIRVLPYSSISQRFAIFRKPLFRGVVTLIESMIQGVDALSYSAHIAADSQAPEEKTQVGYCGLHRHCIPPGNGIICRASPFSDCVGNGEWRDSHHSQNPVFHLLDGGLKILILLIYVYFDCPDEDIHRVFQYHGAEHKSIYTFEAGEELTVENARNTRLFIRDVGLVFFLFLVLISIAVF